MAAPMPAYIIHRSKGLRDDLAPVMPGAVWEFRDPVHLKKANAEGIANETALAILGCRDSITCREVSKLLGIADTPAAKQAFTRGGKLVESLDSGGANVGHNFKRGSARYGFLGQG
jgi:hypothetical protein